MKRQLQKRETLLKNIDRDIAKIVEIDRLNLAKKLRIYGAPVILRIPDQSCHLFQPNAATHSISKLPPIPVNAATH